ncbi:MAG: outer membrane beta-barrel protein [Bacteroidia bacterium]
MKSATTALFILLLLSSCCMAQEDRFEFRKQPMFGLKAGINYSIPQFQKGMPFSISEKTGMCGGAQLSVPFSLLFGIQPELMLGQRGFVSTGNLKGAPYMFTRIGNYVDVPFFFTYKPNALLTLLAGPQYSRLYKSNDLYSVSEMGLSKEGSFLNARFRQNQLGLLAGLDVNKQYMIVGIRTGVDTGKSLYDNATASPAYRNVWLQFTFGYRY